MNRRAVGFVDRSDGSTDISLPSFVIAFVPVHPQAQDAADEQWADAYRHALVSRASGLHGLLILQLTSLPFSIELMASALEGERHNASFRRNWIS
jgi:hypothetical protein